MSAAFARERCSELNLPLAQAHFEASLDFGLLAAASSQQAERLARRVTTVLANAHDTTTYACLCAAQIEFDYQAQVHWRRLRREIL